MDKPETQSAVGSTRLLDAVVREHRERRKGHVSGPWYINTPRRRKIRLQDFKGRVYLVGCVYDGMHRILDFECPLGEIIRRYGKPASI